MLILRSRLFIANKIRCSAVSILIINRHQSDKAGPRLEKPNLRFGSVKKLPTFSHQDERAEETNRPTFYNYLLLAVPIFTFILGTWQVQRRQWKLKLIDNLNTRVTSPTKPLPEDLNDLDTMEYMPVKVTGEFLYDREFTIGPKSLILDGQAASEKGAGGGLTGIAGRKYQGFWVITPFKLADRDLTILVNRGWLRNKLDRIPAEQLEHIPGEMEITGLVRLDEKRPSFMPKNNPAQDLWFYRDLKSMALRAGTDPVYIEVVADAHKNYDAQSGPIPGQTRVTMRNEHLTYIITWYSLSFFTSLMWYKQFVRG